MIYLFLGINRSMEKFDNLDIVQSRENYLE